MSARASKLFWVWVLAVVTILLVLDRMGVAYPPWNGTGVQNTWSAAASSPTANPNWSVIDWWIDPTNGSDGNTCQSSGSPCKTWAAVNGQRRGCLPGAHNCPRLRQNTNIHWVNANPCDTDPIYDEPALENGAAEYHVGTLGATQQIATGTLGTVTAKNRATPQLLQVVLPAPTGAYAAQQLVVNSTHASRAWLFSLVSGNTWTITQPLAASAMPPVYSQAVSEVDTWTAGDTVTVYQPTSVCGSVAKPQIEELQLTSDGGNLFFNQGVVFYQLDIAAGPRGKTDSFNVNGNVTFIESSSHRVVQVESASTSAAYPFVQTNDAFAGVLWPTPSMSDLQWSMFGGAFYNAGYVAAASFLADADAILQPGYYVGRTIQFGLVYIASGGAVAVQQGQATTLYYGSTIVWGPGTLNIEGGGRFNYPAGASNAAATFKVATLQLNGQTKGCLGVPTAASAFGTCNLSVTATQLDTSLGATNGCIGTPNGAAFCNYGF